MLINKKLERVARERFYGRARADYTRTPVPYTARRRSLTAIAVLSYAR